MALQKTHVLNSEFSANYWKIHSIESMNINSLTAEIRLALYKDAAARTSGVDKFADTFIVELNGDDFPFAIADQDVVSKNTSKLFYEQIKTMSALKLNNDENNTVDFTTGTTDV